MLEFILNSKNHSSFDDTEIDFNILNDRKRVPLHVCFTPPTLTYLAQINGISNNGTPVAIKPEDVESMVDWIRPGIVIIILS